MSSSERNSRKTTESNQTKISQTQQEKKPYSNMPHDMVLHICRRITYANAMKVMERSYTVRYPQRDIYLYFSEFPRTPDKTKRLSPRTWATSAAPAFCIYKISSAPQRERRYVQVIISVLRRHHKWCALGVFLGVHWRMRKTLLQIEEEATEA